MIISGNIGTFIAAAAATAALIVLEVLLARKKRFLFGLIPVISVALLFLGIGLYAVHVQGTYTVREDSYKYPGGAAAVISLRLDRESRIVSFSDLDIYDSRGKLQDTAIFSAADKGESMCLAQLPGYASAGYLVERIGRKPVLVIYFLGTAVASGLFGNAATIGQVITFGCLLYFFSLGAWGCVYAYTPEVYPTRVRGTGCGWASAFGRVGAFLGALVVPVIYQAFGSSGGYGKVFIFLTIVFVAVAVVVMIFGKETKGRSLEMITE